MLKGWQTATHAITIQMDSDLTTVPPATTVWLLGSENTLAPVLFARQPGLAIADTTVTIGGRAVPLAGHTVVIMTQHPIGADERIGWIAVDPIEALPGLGRKLPHYGKYSYVAFEGAEPTNVLSGEWRDVDSPLRVDLRPAADRSATLAALPPDPARPLIEPVNDGPR